MDKKELKWIYYELNKISSKSVISGKRLWTESAENTLLTLESVNFSRAPGPRVEYSVLQGLLMKNPLEGVSFFLGRRSRSGRSTGHQGGLGGGPAVCSPSGAAVAMDREVELAGVCSLLVSGHGFKK